MVGLSRGGGGNATSVNFQKQLEERDTQQDRGNSEYSVGRKPSEYKQAME